MVELDRILPAGAPSPAPPIRHAAGGASSAAAGSAGDRVELGSLNESITSGGTTLDITYDDSLGKVIVKVRSSESGEILRQIPPEEYLRFASRLRELIGVLFDQRF